MLTWFSGRPFQRVPIRTLRTLLIAVLVAAVAATILDARAPALRAAQPKISATRICDDSVNAMEAEYGKQIHTVTSEPVVTVQAASYTVDAQQTKIVTAKKKEATADCVSKLHKAAQAGWSYGAARAVEIAVDTVVTVLASTLICSVTGPVGCRWGVRIASFVSGFVAALAFQYLTDGYLNKSSVAYAFLDAAASLLAFSNLDKLQSAYVGQGVKATFKAMPAALKSVASRIGGAGSAMVNDISQTLNIVLASPRWSMWISRAGYTGGGSIEPVIAEKRGQPIADGLQFRIPSHATGSPVHDNLWSGAYSHPYYNWDIAETPHYNKDGAIGYVIGQGNSCLGYNASPHRVVLKPCNYNDHTQWWFVDGDELMADNGQCLVEVENAQARMMDNCDGLNYQANPENKDDQFIATPPGGTYIPNTVFNWKSHISYYEHA